MIPSATPPTPKRPGKPRPPATATRFRANDHAYWGYLLITRAGAAERHQRTCPQCRTIGSGEPGSGACNTGWVMAARADAAADHVRQLAIGAAELPQLNLPEWES